MMFIFGVLLFGALVTMPQFLQTVLGYTAENAGLVLSGGGAVVLALMPIVGMLAGQYPAKYIIAAGWLALAIGMYVSTVRLDTLISFQSATVLRLIQSVGLGLLFVPGTMAGYIGMSAEKANSVAGIINFMRNIGSSVGTSMVTTLLARRAQVHQVVLRSTPLGSIGLFRTR
jgi:DHA2 family multidrug resistance protein